MTKNGYSKAQKLSLKCSATHSKDRNYGNQLEKVKLINILNFFPCFLDQNDYVSFWLILSPISSHMGLEVILSVAELSVYGRCQLAKV